MHMSIEARVRVLWRENQRFNALQAVLMMMMIVETESDCDKLSCPLHRRNEGA